MSTRMTMRQKAYRTSKTSRAVLAQRRALRLAARSMGPARSWTSRTAKQGELKGMDTIITNGNPVGWVNPIISTTNTNGCAAVLNLIQTGTGSWNRIGRKTSLKSVRIKGYARAIIWQNATNDFVGNTLRLIFVWDKQPSGGTIPVFDSIFADTNQSGAESTTVFSQTAYDSLDRFRVIKDMTMDFNQDCSPAATQNNSIFVNIDEYIRLPDLESNYSGQSVPMTIADINSGALYLYARSLANAVNDTTIELNAVCRVRYTD